MLDGREIWRRGGARGSRCRVRSLVVFAVLLGGDVAGDFLCVLSFVCAVEPKVRTLSSLEKYAYRGLALALRAGMGGRISVQS